MPPAYSECRLKYALRPTSKNYVSKQGARPCSATEFPNQSDLPSSSARQLAVLRQIARVNSTVVSVSQLSADFSCSLATVRNVIRSLEHKGLISVQARFLRNGGQLENEYEVTQEGIRVLECDDALAKDER